MPDAALLDPTILEAFNRATTALVHVANKLDERDRSSRARSRPLRFHLDVYAPGDVTHTPSGVLKFLHNPNTAPVAFTLVEVMSRRTMWSGTLAAGDQAGVWVPFAGGIDCTVLALPASSLAIILAGEYDAFE